jgi:hypothetical protein
VRDVEGLLHPAPQHHVERLLLKATKSPERFLPVEIAAQSVERPAERVAIVEAIDLHSLRQSEPAHQFQPFDGSVGRTHVPGFPNIGLPIGGQPDEWGEIGMIGSAKLRRDRAHRRVPVAIAAIIAAAGERVARLEGDGSVITGPAIDRAENREAVGDRRLAGEVFGERHAGDGGGDGSEGAADFAGGERLGVPHVELAGSA